MENFYKFNKFWLSAKVLPTAIHVLHNNKVVVGTAGVKDELEREIPGQVVVLTENGKKYQIYEFDSNKEALFTVPHRITSNINRDIIVLDRPPNRSVRLRSLDNEGNIKWDYTGSPILNQKHYFDPWDLVTTSHDSIITCDYSNDILHILNSKGDLINNIRLKTFDISRPVSMAIMENETLLIGCRSTTDNAKIHKLQIMSRSYPIIKYILHCTNLPE
ncbi:unnamed protein product [Mytilus coruscus]|uniref:Uncharacterized protein n=1 Tax=Mytilus coruscus TaxID=42192 RepID=A0A6J8DCQ0_MYTCO|nr:unnamed protein product [Mytilus coruscus]